MFNYFSKKKKQTQISPVSCFCFMPILGYYFIHLQIPTVICKTSLSSEERKQGKEERGEKTPLPPPSFLRVNSSHYIQLSHEWESERGREKEHWNEESTTISGNMSVGRQMRSFCSFHVNGTHTILTIIVAL